MPLAKQHDPNPNLGYIKPIREGEIEEELKRRRPVLACFGIFFSILLLITSIGYLIVSLLAAFDKHGKEVYFDQDPGREYTFREFKDAKIANPSWTPRTDDWGYFYRGYYRNKDSYWEKYDVFLLVIVTSAITTFLWILTSLLGIYKYAARVWRLAAFTFSLTFIAFIFNLVGSVWAFYRISIFLS